MKLEDLTGVSVDVLDKLSNDELYKLCEPFFNVTRPELASKISTSKPVKVLTQAEKEHAARIEFAKKRAFEQLGIKL